MSICSVKLKSNYLFGPTDVSIVLPNPPMDGNPREFYESGDKFPVLWLLHGGKNTFRDWLLGTNVGRYAIERGIILVIPDGQNSDFTNHSEFGDGYYFLDFFFEELMPFIYNWFPASDKPEDNFIAGNSMGCAATWIYGLLYPEKFGCIAPLSNQPLNYEYLEPYRNLTSAEFRAIVAADKHAFPSAYGILTGGIHVKEVNTIAKYPTVGDFLDSYEHTWARFREAAAAEKLPKVYLPGTTRDGKMLEFKEYADALRVKNIAYDLSDVNAHCFDFWESAVRKFLDFAGLKKVDYFVGS
jgi:putative tributyrin esterase